MTFNVIKGPAVLAVGAKWRGVASGNVGALCLRDTAAEALEDAKRIEAGGCGCVCHPEAE